MTNKMTIIGVSGPIGSGKDTFAEELARMVGRPVERHAFADKLRETCETLTGYVRVKTHEAGQPFQNAVYNYTQEDKNVYLEMWDKTVGEILQQLGTNCLRQHFDGEVWVKSLISNISDEVKNGEHILVIPDVRFKNEANALLEMGATLIRLEGDPADVRKNSKRDLNHISEIDLNDYDKFTMKIHNDKPGMEILRNKISDTISVLDI